MIAPTLAPTKAAYGFLTPRPVSDIAEIPPGTHQTKGHAPEEKVMSAIRSLATRPVARLDCSTTKSQHQAAGCAGNHVVAEPSPQIVREAVDLKSGGSAAYFAVRSRRLPMTASRSEDCLRRSEKWRCLMIAAQGGENRAYETLLRELDAWLRRYYARRLPTPAAEDAKQEALLAIHAQRHAYMPSRSFVPWVAAIARNKWVDRVREASRFASLPLSDEIPSEDRGGAAISAVVVDNLLRRLKPAQARVIRLVKLQGVSIEGASEATGQSASLVKVNIHRGLKKLVALVAGDAIAPITAANSSEHRTISSNPNRSNRFSSHRLRDSAADK